MRVFFAAMLFALLTSTGAFAQSFPNIKVAAEAKNLPTKMVAELIASGARVTIQPTDGGPHYQPGTFGGGTIYLPFATTALADWHRGDWADFYNELFSAWWGNVFMKTSSYAADRQALLNDSALAAKYRRAVVSARDTQLAQEEGYSETMASVISVAYPQIRLDPATGQYIYVNVPYETLYYRMNWTVAAVGHSDRPGYTPEAENTFLDEREYDYVMRWAYGKPAPIKP